MKRSEINNLIKRTVKFLERQNFKLPPFAFWSPENWPDKLLTINKISREKLKKA